jgi:hypothetical protein
MLREVFPLTAERCVELGISLQGEYCVTEVSLLTEMSRHWIMLQMLKRKTMEYRVEEVEMYDVDGILVPFNRYFIPITEVEKRLAIQKSRS